MSFNDRTLYSRDDEADEYGESGFGEPLEEDFDEEEEDEEYDEEDYLDEDEYDVDEDLDYEDFDQ